MERMLRYKALSEQVYELLHKEISEMSPGNNKLPSEDEIAKKYGISRSTVRDALTLLKMEGGYDKGPGTGNLCILRYLKYKTVWIYIQIFMFSYQGP